MNVKEVILKELIKRVKITTSEVVKLTHISRQAISKHFQDLIKSNKIVKIGKTRGSYYILNEPNSLKKEFGKPVIENGCFENINVEEDKIFQSIKKNSFLFTGLKNNIAHILEYAFTEMLNNAIEHSKSKKVYYCMQKSGDIVSFYIKDQGIGVYANIKNKFKLDSNWDGLQELIKGKNTTDPQNHIGKGIFFTSRIADKFTLTSHKVELFVDNLIDDLFFREVRNYHGTIVEFSININSDKTLESIFAQYANEEFVFDKNQVRVSLFQEGESYISRSQAKRLLTNLNKYHHIILDFKGIKSIGQGFADQVFRIFKNEHPNIKIETVNCKQAVELMIKRAKSQ